MKKPRFLIVRRDNIGDLVCTLPAVAALRQRYPQAHIGMLVNTYNRAVVDGNPDIDEVFAYEKGKHREEGEGLLGVYWERLRMMQVLRRRHFDYAILAAPSFQASAMRFARWIRPAHIVGYADGAGDKAKMIDLALPAASADAHEAQRVFNLFSILDVHGMPSPARIFPDAGEVTRIRESMPAGMSGLVAVHISARKPSQRWPVERFAELMRTLHGMHGVRFLLLWAPGPVDDPRHPGDDEKAGRLMRAVAGVPVHALPTASLQQLIAALSIVDSAVLSDGGAMHVAAGLGKPVVCLFGDSLASRWHPWGVPHRLLQPESRDVGDIATGDVVAAWNDLRQDIHESSGGVKA